jgi:DNA-3-methyladenine glycosylase II
MSLVASKLNLAKAAQHLIVNDSVMAKIIKSYGSCNLKPHKNYYQELVDSIISQQLSVKAARSIEQRFCQLFGSENFPPPEAIVKKSVDELRTVGLSRAKAAYVIDLAHHVIGGQVKFDEIDSLSNEEVISELTAVKGIGEWTAHMFMIFCMGRLDILPYGDLGIKNGIRKLYGLKALPDGEKIKQIAKENNWHPYESVASWYIWRSLDNTPKN